MTQPASAVAKPSSQEEGIDMRNPIMQISQVSRAFGGVKAVDTTEISIPRNTLTALIGPNGAGKSTLFNIVSGFEKADTGTWSFDGKDISRMQPYAIARIGMRRTFQLTRALGQMTLLENMKLSAVGQRGEKLLRSPFRFSWKAQEKHIHDQAMTLLERFRLGDKAQDVAESLSGGQRRLLEVARALMAEPTLLLLDEPLAGVNPALRETVMEHLLQLRDDGLSMLFIEHDMDAVMGLSDYVICLAAGKNIAAGTPTEVAQNPAVIDAYLGEGAADVAADAATAAEALGATSHVTQRAQVGTDLNPDTASGNTHALVFENIHAGYGPEVRILHGASGYVDPNEIVAVIGANGAGKSTLLKAIVGEIKCDTGTVRQYGQPIEQLPLFRRARHQLGYVPQSANVFPDMTIEENARMGYRATGKPFSRDALHRVLELFPMFQDRLKDLAGSLSGGQRQSLAMMRALISDPQVLLLDEPSAGLSPMAQEEAFEHIQHIAAAGVSILIVEQNARQCLAISHRGYVLEQGKVALAGTGEELLNDPRIIELYLGSMYQNDNAQPPTSAGEEQEQR